MEHVNHHAINLSNQLSKEEKGFVSGIVILLTTSTHQLSHVHQYVPQITMPEESSKTCEKCSDSMCKSCPTESGKKCSECEDGAVLDIDGSCKGNLFVPLVFTN